MFTDVLNISHINGIIQHRVFFNCRGSSISSISKCIFVFRVGAKNSGTRFLSFVDTMLGYRHLLTAEDLNKAASMCSSLKGVLRSRFLVLSDDKDPPPPPARGKRSHPDGDNTTTAGGKRFQTRAQAPQGQTTVEAQINAEPRPSLHRQPAPGQGFIALDSGLSDGGHIGVGRAAHGLWAELVVPASPAEAAAWRS